MTQANIIDRLRADDHDWRSLVVLGVCTWEIVAIVSGRVPTITSVWHRFRTHHLGRLGLWLVLGWLISHLFYEGAHDHRACIVCATMAKWTPQQPE